jgi:hypothetical protein
VLLGVPIHKTASTSLVAGQATTLLPPPWGLLLQRWFQLCGQAVREAQGQASDGITHTDGTRDGDGDADADDDEDADEAMMTMTSAAAVDIFDSSKSDSKYHHHNDDDDHDDDHDDDDDDNDGESRAGLLLFPPALVSVKTLRQAVGDAMSRQTARQPGSRCPIAPGAHRSLCGSSSSLDRPTALSSFVRH